jgi:uncharacterized protein
MIRIVHQRRHSLSLCIRLLIACIVIGPYSRIVRAATPNVHQLQAKAERGFVNQEIELAEAYFTGNGVEHDVKLAAYWYQKAAESGDPESQNLVGSLYEVGLGVPVDAARALHWYQLSAASGLSDAAVNLGVIYELGLGVKKDVLVAAQYFEKAVQRGNGTGATYLGTLYYSGIGVKEDKVAAEHWYVIGQKMHDPISAYNLGALYLTAPDHPHDISKGVRFLRQSAAAKYVPAMYSLALLVIQHTELAKSRQEAQDLLELTANAGYWKSSVVQGIVARDGKGVSVDSKAAYYHFRVAILQGGEVAENLIGHDARKLATMLGTEQSQALESEATSWFQQHRLTPAFVHIKGQRDKIFSDPTGRDPAAVLNAALPLSNPSS